MIEPAWAGEALSQTRMRPGVTRRTLIGRALALGVSLAGIAPLLAACGSSEEATQTPAEGQRIASPTVTSVLAATPSVRPTVQSPGTAGGPQEIVIAQGLDPETLDPHATTVSASENVAALVVERFVTYDYGKGGIQGVLAEGWRTIDDLTWEVKLREGVTFTNGEPVNAEAAKFSLERIQGMPHATGQRFAQQKLAVEIVDEYTIRLRTERPFPFMIFELGRVSIVPPKYVQEVGDQVYGREPIGTGPFLFQEWVKGDHVTLVRNEKYWGPLPSLTKVTYRSIPEPSSRTAALLTGEADLITLVSLSDIPRIKDNPDCEVIAETSNRSMFVRFDCADSRLKDPRVRQALNYAVDKEAIVQTLLQGYGEVLDGQPVGKHIVGYNPALKPYPYDPDKARNLLQEAGFDFSTMLTIYTPVGRYMADKEITEAVAGMLGDIGVQAQVQPLEWSVWISKYNDGTLTPMTFIGIHTFYPDAFPLLNLHVTGSLGGMYYNPQYDEIIAKAAVTVDQDERVKLYHQALELMHDDPAVLFLHQQKDVYAISKRVRGWKPRPDEFIDLSGVSIASA